MVSYLKTRYHCSQRNFYGDYF